MENATFGLTWEDATTVVQTEEVITTIENEIIPSQSEEFMDEVENVMEEELVDDVGMVEEEVVQDNSQLDQEVLEQQDGELVYLSDGNVIVMQENQEEAYSEDQLMEVTEEVITDQWGESYPEEIIVGSEEAVSATGSQTPGDEDDIPLPTDQDEYTAARPYPCDFCSRRFRKKANLMNHMVAHQTDRPHGCNLCGIRYVRKADLMNHLKSHAYISDNAPIEEDEDTSLVEDGFDRAERKARGYGKRKRKKPVKDEYESVFVPADTASSSAQFEYTESGDINYMVGEAESNSEYISNQDEIKYPVTDPKKPFVCQHCGVAFAREKALASHARVHGGDSPFECQTCGEMFWDIALMQEHARTKHGELEDYDDDEDEDYSDSEETKYGTFYCPTCGLSFHRQDNLRRHSRIHIKEEYVNENELGHICNVCGESFQEALDLLAHAEVHARGSEYRCMICGEVCLEEMVLSNHVQSAHKNLPPHTCILCGRTCKDSRTLLKHSWEHSKDKPFGCTRCSKTFHNRARLKRHMLSHRNKVVTCDVCGEDFADGRSLMNHRHSHTSISGRQFPCKECGKTFGSRSSQQIHIRIHTGERPYGCRFCWKAFADGGTLRKHERIHTGEKPYACAVCPRAFNQRVVLREHIRSHHSGPDPKYSHSMTPYCCTVCSDMFATSQDLILHLIHHCDMNTAMKRQPQVGPRKYKRRTTSDFRRKLKPHELDSIAAHNQLAEERYNARQEEAVDQEYQNQLSEEEPEVRRRTRKASVRKVSTSSPKASISESVSEIYNSLHTIESNDSVLLPKSPTSKVKYTKKKINEGVPIPSRPKMIHTQKTRVPVETGEDGRIRHKTRTLVTRTQPAEIKSSTGERIRPRTKNVNYHILNAEKLPLATFPIDDQTEEAVENLLRETVDDSANGEVLTEEFVEETDIAAEQIVETEVPVPVSLVEVRTRRNSTRSSRNVIGPGSKVRLVKEGMVVSKIRRSSESQNEPESILPDIHHTDQIYVKDEHHNNQNQHDDVVSEAPENISEYTSKMQNIKRELMDPSALHELAEISMRHANSATNNIFKCEMCDEVFTDRGQLLVHVPIHI
ncbi:zinc finger protein 41 isoform X2 [Dendroctonus ponderosae]|uniref:C2H2-type domain-containing protein n=1 Tax=Dendroctonus ponderosae TaxID=77166 RepID=A0AAR5P633_DENPD|nr:zinc finger protein 41 isoform X2 [Dendroctonus ponderosae]